MTRHHQSGVADDPEQVGIEGKPLPGPLAAIDRFQKRHAVVGVPVAVAKKFGDDEAGKLAALISYYGFLSVFPLLIVLATVLSHALSGNPELAGQVLDSAAGSFLSIGATGRVQPLDVSGFALVIAMVVAIWSGLAVANAMQDAMNTIYEVAKTKRPGLAGRSSRSLALLVAVGVGLPLTAVLQGFGLRGTGTPIGVMLVFALTLGLNCLLIATAFRVSTVARTSWRGVLPGAALAAVAWSVMQALGAGLLTRKVASAQSDYGDLAIVVALLFWLFVLAQVTICCAELNAVLSLRLWPRGLRSVVRSEAETDADRRSYASYPAREKAATNVQVSVSVEDGRPPR